MIKPILAIFVIIITALTLFWYSAEIQKLEKTVALLKSQNDSLVTVKHQTRVFIMKRK